jgi:hypothetical protein
MDAERSRAYQRVIRSVDELSASKLHRDEQAVIRAAADAMLFAQDPTDPGGEAHAAVAELTGLFERLATADRLTPETLDRLLGDVSACGPTALNLAA